MTTVTNGIRIKATIFVPYDKTKPAEIAAAAGIASKLADPANWKPMMGDQTVFTLEEAKSTQGTRKSE